MSSKFNEVSVEDEVLNGFHIKDLNWDTKGVCKRCGKKFTKRYKEQIFHNAHCASFYRKTWVDYIEEGAINKHGQSFEEWMDDTWDWTYSPEKFDEFNI